MSRIPRIFPLLLVLLLAHACRQEAAESSMAETAASGVTETERLNAWFAEKNEERLAFSPMTLTELGRRDLYDRIDQMSVAAEEEQLAWMAGTVEELRENFDYQWLDPEARISYDLWIHAHEQAAANQRFHGHQYLFNQMNGAHTGLPTFMINYHRVESPADMEAYIVRISGISRALGQLLARARQYAGEGVRPPRFAYVAVIEEAGNIISGRPFQADAPADAPLWEDARNKIGGLLESGAINGEEAADLEARAQAALRTELLPAYEELIAWFEEDLPNSDVEPRGAYHLPDGEAFYARMLASYTTTDMSPAEVHQVGLAEVDRLMGEMEAIRQAVGFDGDLQAFLEFVGTDERFYYPDTDAGRQAYIEDTRTFIEAMKARLPQYFGILPKADLVVRRVEAFREQDGAAAHYYPSSVDGSIPGIYYMHLSDMGANPRTEMESTAYHEGLPGHHMQIAIARELTGVPEFRGQFFYNAYVEGWALYSEYLAKEMGAYQDPYSDFGRLSNEMWRAVRLVVDTGMHAMGWSEEQAVDYFKARTITPEEAVVSEIRRYLVWPGQAASYKIGMLKILDLRDRARQALGEDFDIREFHDMVLGGGALPLVLLERRVNEWMEAEQGRR